MGRPATGHLSENRSAATGRLTSWGLQFSHAGRRRYLTLPATTRDQALREMTVVMDEVRQGVWVPPRPRRSSPARGAMPSFEKFAGTWVLRQKDEGGRRQTGLSAAGQADLQWRFEHLLAHFAWMPMDEITVSDVDDFRLAKVREGALGATSINKMLTTLAAILETAVEYELIARNPAKGRRRRLPATKPHRSWLDRADHITALLDAAREIDRESRAGAGLRRPLIATLLFAGLRVGELMALRWSDVDLARGTIRVRQAKTDAGVRIVHVLPVLHGELAEHRDLVTAGPSELVFGTGSGRPLGASNIRIRVLARAVQRADAELEARGRQPLPAGLTPHSLRRTFASLLFAIGEPPTYVMSQMGHTTAGLTLALYAREMNRRDGEQGRLSALVAPRPREIGTGTISSTSTAIARRATSQRWTSDQSSGAHRRQPIESSAAPMRSRNRRC
jgi:integrase